jgi:hypothetical protein
MKKTTTKKPKVETAAVPKPGVTVKISSLEFSTDLYEGDVGGLVVVKDNQLKLQVDPVSKTITLLDNYNSNELMLAEENLHPLRALIDRAIKFVEERSV